MILGERAFFTKEHFEAHKGVAPAHLCELVVYCLELVAQLGKSGLEFRFKGGNSQLILLEDPQRFSIDVDIVTTVSKEELINVVQGIAEHCDAFRSCEVRQHKTKPWLPMISFKLFFDSIYQPPEEAYVMLDAVLEEPPYAGVRKEVRCGALYRSTQSVELPSVPGLIADKMLCIGPSTVGIPLGKNKEAQRLKHVFDVATLSRQRFELPQVLQDIGRCLEQENQLQKSQWSLPEVIEDTRRFCAEPLEHATKPNLEALEQGTYLYEIAFGFDGFRSHLFRIDYTWERFQSDCRAVLGVLDTFGGG